MVHSQKKQLIPLYIISIIQLSVDIQGSVLIEFREDSSVQMHRTHAIFHNQAKRARGSDF